MKRFTALFNTIDQTNSTNEKIHALVAYFNETTDADKLWTIAVFSGRNPKKVIKTNQLRAWAAEAADIPLWLFEESYHIVGDLSETISSVLPDYTSEIHLTLTQTIEEFEQIAALSETDKKQFIISKWKSFSKHERFVYNKLTSGSFRMGVSTRLILKALSKHTAIDENVLAHRLAGSWSPYTTTFQELLFNEHAADDLSKPYPFCLAYPVEGAAEELGDIALWQAEYKWDGIRAQVIVRDGEIFIWSRGEELMTAKFPELELLKGKIPDGTVLDGELLPYKHNRILSFNELQTRIGRKKITAGILEKTPVVFYAYDLLENKGTDIRTQPLENRRVALEQLISDIHHPALFLSPILPIHSWKELATAREEARLVAAEGLMLKRKSSAYQVGRKKGDWWKWKIDPLSADAVLLYAQSGHGRRANLYTDYTFAVWDHEKKLVPFAKAYSGLTDKEIEMIDDWIKKNTIEKFGPVRSVKPELVFEIGFEGINTSSRHKSGIAVRFPRILRWRTDKKAEEADTLNSLQLLIDSLSS